MHRCDEAHPRDLPERHEDGGVRLEVMHVHHIDPSAHDQPGEVPEHGGRAQRERGGRHEPSSRDDGWPKVHVHGRKPESRQPFLRRHRVSRKEKQRLAVPFAQRAGQVADDRIHAPVELIPGHDE